MTDVAVPTGADAPHTARPRLTRALVVASALVVALAAVYSGMNSADKTKSVLPLALIVAVLLGVLALTRFSVFVLIVLGLRASIDLFKLSGSSAGNTATNTAASRSLDPSSILVVLFIIAALLWLAAQLASGRRLRGSWVRTALVSMGLLGFISSLGSANLQASALEATRVLAVVMMYVVLEQLITDDRSMRQVIGAVYASAVFPLLYTLVSMVLGSPPSEVKGSFTRITGPFSQSTTFGRYLAFLIIFGVAIFPYLSRAQKRLMVPTLGLSSVFLLLTLTRGALFGAIAGLVVVGLVQRNTKLLLGFAAAIVGALVLVPGLFTRLMELTAEDQTGGGQTGNTLAWRLNYWSEVIGLVKHNPMTGIGLNMTQYMTDQAKQPHNDFLRTLVETGTVGFLAFIGWLWALVAQAARAIRVTRADTLERGIAAGVMGCAVALVGQSAGSNVMSNVVSLWYLVAFAAATSYLVRTGSPAGDPTSSSAGVVPAEIKEMD